MMLIKEIKALLWHVGKFVVTAHLMKLLPLSLYPVWHDTVSVWFSVYGAAGLNMASAIIGVSQGMAAIKVHIRW